MQKSYILVIALGAVYYLIVYLAVRRGGRPIIPWMVSVLAQVVSAVFYLPLSRRIADFLAPLAPTAGYVVAALILIALNYVIIVLSFKYLKPKRPNFEDMEAEMQDFELKPIETVPSSEFIRKVENATSSVVEEDTKDDRNNEKVMEEIDGMIASGSMDDAVRYLKMVAYYGSNEELSNRAKEKLAELTESVSFAAAASEDEVEVEAEIDNDQE